MNRIIAAVALVTTLFITPVFADTDEVLNWNNIMLTALEGQNPLVQARIAAITHLAIFEAVNSVTGDFTSYLRAARHPDASPEAAAVMAAYSTLVRLLPDKADMLKAARHESLSKIPDGPAKTEGIELGRDAAIDVILLRANDGSEPAQVYNPPPTPEPGQWQLTGSCTGGVFLQVPKVTPFALRRGDQFRSDPPPALRSFKYAQAYNEVKDLGSIDSQNRPPDRADVAIFYSKVLSTFIWNPVASQMAATQNKSLSENARAFALLNMAIFDAFIANFDTKYQFPFWRPETAIHLGDLDGNPNTSPDTGFVPFVPTPCHPSYQSALAALGSAARVVLERIYGPTGHSITLSSPAVPGVILHYHNLRTIMADIDDARLYGGIHFRFDQAAGEKQGHQVGNYIFKNKLRRVRDWRRVKEYEGQ